jgi:hypothetical protein
MAPSPHWRMIAVERKHDEKRQRNDSKRPLPLSGDGQGAALGAMKLTGDKTEAVYRGYAIVGDADVQRRPETSSVERAMTTSTGVSIVPDLLRGLFCVYRPLDRRPVARPSPRGVQGARARFGQVRGLWKLHPLRKYARILARAVSSVGRAPDF